MTEIKEKHEEKAKWNLKEMKARYFEDKVQLPGKIKKDIIQ